MRKTDESYLFIPSGTKLLQELVQATRIVAITACAEVLLHRSVFSKLPDVKSILLLISVATCVFISSSLLSIAKKKRELKEEYAWIAATFREQLAGMLLDQLTKVGASLYEQGSLTGRADDMDRLFESYRAILGRLPPPEPTHLRRLYGRATRGKDWGGRL